MFSSAARSMPCRISTYTWIGNKTSVLQLQIDRLLSEVTSALIHRRSSNGITAHPPYFFSLCSIKFMYYYMDNYKSIYRAAYASCCYHNIPPVYYGEGSRKFCILHSRLRHQCSSLKADLLKFM
jgi:hypothetical protein